MSATELEVKEPDEMGSWAEEGDIVWLPRSLYPARSAAIKWATEQWACHWLDVRCLSRWMRYTPENGEDFWTECDRDEPGSFQVWRLESA